MIKIQNLPDWFYTVGDLQSENVIASLTVAYERDGAYYFDGVISALLAQNKIPHNIEIALDAEHMFCIARLNYGDESDEAAMYMPFEVESFAFLWNANPGSIHGILGNRVTLTLHPAETRYPIICAGGITAELYLHGDVFVASPHPEFADEFLDELEPAA